MSILPGDWAPWRLHRILYTSEAARAYDLGVFDFICKPISEARFSLTADRIRASIVEPVRSIRYLARRSRGRVDMIDIGEISDIKAAKNYSEIHLTSGDNLLHELNLRACLHRQPCGMHCSITVVISSSAHGAPRGREAPP